MSERLPRITADEVIKVLEHAGCLSAGREQEACSRKGAKMPRTRRDQD
jgi:hypothetical protein